MTAEIQIMNRPAAWIAVGTVVGLPLAAWGVYAGIMCAVHADHTKLLHQGHGIKYTLTDCTAAPGKSGTLWTATMTFHNTNRDQANGYGVQVQFISDGAPVAWTRVTDIPDMAAGDAVTVRPSADVNVSGVASVACTASFYRGGDPIGATSPQPVG